MKFGFQIPVLLALTMGLSAQAATLTKISKLNYSDAENFRKVAVAAQKLAYSDFRMEVVFEVEAYKVSDLHGDAALESVTEALSKLGYGDAKPAELSDIDDQVDDTISAAFLLNLDGVPKAAKAKMEKLEQEASKNFSYGDSRIRVFSAETMDANHYDINAIVVYDVQKQEVLVVASQKSE